MEKNCGIVKERDSLHFFTQFNDKLCVSAYLQRAHLLPDLSSAVVATPHIHQQTFPIAVTQQITTTPILPVTLDPSSPTNTTSPNQHNALIYACIFASTVAKRAAELAFADKRRSMTAPDVIERIGTAFQDIVQE